MEKCRREKYNQEAGRRTRCPSLPEYETTGLRYGGPGSVEDRAVLAHPVVDIDARPQIAAQGGFVGIRVAGKVHGGHEAALGVEALHGHGLAVLQLGDLMD